MITKSKFFPEIESLRAIAVVMTMMAHYIPSDSKYYVPHMATGVDLFFTISGFLITLILFRALNSDSSNNKKTLLKNFFVRRVLRLFPSYYLVLIVFFILKNVFSIYIWNNDYNLYFFTYLQNIYFFKTGVLPYGFGHLWSLGVEEQFYLVWPFIIIYMRKQWLPYIFVILICTSIILNTIYQIPLFDCLPYANFHTLGIGALLAWLYYYKLDSKILSVIQKYKMIAFIISISILVWSYNTRNIERHVIVAIQETFLMLTTGIIVLNSVTGWPTSLKFIFNNKTLHHIGKISYGIYLYHFIIPLFINLLEIKIPAISYYIPKTVFGNFIFLACLTYITALISYNIFEIKFLKLKTNFTN